MSNLIALKLSEEDIVLLIRAAIFRGERLYDLHGGRSPDQTEEMLKVQAVKSVLMDKLGNVTILHPDITDAAAAKMMRSKHG